MLCACKSSSYGRKKKDVKGLQNNKENRSVVGHSPILRLRRSCNVGNRCQPIVCNICLGPIGKRDGEGLFNPKRYNEGNMHSSNRCSQNEGPAIATGRRKRMGGSVIQEEERTMRLKAGEAND